VPTHSQVGRKGTASRTALIELAEGVTSVPLGWCVQTFLGGFDETDGKKGAGYGILPLLRLARSKLLSRSKMAA
jgi:hypothetical protein